MRRSLIITPAGLSCNLSCDYCYNGSRKKEKLAVMENEILEKLISKAFFENNTRFVWHGGEPLLAGKSFFEKIISLQRQYSRGRHFVNGIQTNCTLIDDEWAEFLVKNDFFISTSIDGDEKMHNFHRKINNQCGSYKNVMSGVKKLLDYGCKRVGVVSVISSNNVEYPEKIFQEVVRVWKTGFEPNPCFETKEMGLRFMPSLDKQIYFFKKLFDLWWNEDNPELHIRLFKDVIRVLMGLNPTDCTYKIDGCRHITGIDEKGDVYTCSRFLKEKDAYLGNILEKDLNKIIYSEKAQKIYDLTCRLNKECMSCKWLKFCGGGCAYQRWLTGDIESKYYACEMRKELFSHITEKIGPLESA